MRTDSLGRRTRLKSTSTGKRLRPRERDLLWFSKIHEHGPLSTSYLHAFSKLLGRSEKKAKERLTDLFNERDTPHGGAYLSRPLQQFRTVDSRYNELVYDLMPASSTALKEAGLWNEYGSSHSGPWLHLYMTSCVTASIELATLNRPDLTYIPGSAILKRANTHLRFLTQIKDPRTGRLIKKGLMPDAIFGLEYDRDGQKSYRFFVVEADRGTEPATSTNFNRKSHQRAILQYQAYIADGAYRRHLKLSAPLLVLNVFSEDVKKQLARKITTDLSPDGNSYMLFQTFSGFAGAFRPPKPQAKLLEESWLRGGRSSMKIG